MRIIKHIFHFSLFIFLFIALTIIGSGCAQIGSPTGGLKDTIPPNLLKATPDFKTTNFTGNKITFTFDEYIEVKDIQKNILISPYPKSNPVIDYKLKTVTIKLKDTLMENTTYSINFGEAIKDINEGNPLKNFTYIFSTGDQIDSMEITGNIKLAQSGKIDSTFIVMLYRKANDSSVQKRKPDYISKVDGKGNFIFTSLPEDDFSIYALLDGNGSKTYDATSEGFAFADSLQPASLDPKPIQLYAYIEEEKKTTPPKPTDKKLNYNTAIKSSSQDLIESLDITFTNPLKTFDTSKIFLTDTLFKRIKNVTTSVDSTNQIVSIKTKWLPDADYRLIIDTLSVSDSNNNKLPKTDTIIFKTKKESDYGTLLLRFSNIPANENLVLQFIKNNEIVKSVPITTSQWSDKLFPPGEYDLRILYDNNNNGKWDTGNYSKKIQPERAVALEQKLSIRANWDNERDIKL